MKKILVVLIGVLSISLISCKKEEISRLPVVTTKPVTTITSNSAASGGFIETQYELVSYGLCWNTSVNPTLDNSNIIDSIRMESDFLRYMTGLNAGTKYYVRAFATNIYGTAYGDELSFTTLPSLPN